MELAPAIKGVSAYMREAHASDAFGTTTPLVSDALVTGGHTIVSLEVATRRSMTAEVCCAFITRAYP